MANTIAEKFSIATTFDVGRALEVGWKGYARNWGTGALLGFLGGLLLIGATLTVAGIIFAVPHLAVGISMVGYYMVKGPLKASTLFSGFKRYGTVLGAGLLFWLVLLCAGLVFSAPYYYHLFNHVGDFSGADLPQRLAQAQLEPEMQGWLAFSYLGFFVQFYLQGRLNIVFPLIIDYNAGILEAFSVSWKVTSRVHGYLFLYYVLVNFLAIIGILLGFLALIVGVFFVLPFPMAAMGAATLQVMGEDTKPEQPVA